eukprot:8013892-Pyramimonas_sp.AAC.1
MASVHCDRCLDPAYPERRRFLAWFVDEHINTIMQPSPPFPRQRTGVGTWDGVGWDGMGWDGVG